jgi:hypothetical protein
VVITTLNVYNLFHHKVSLFFNIIPKHINALVSSWYKFKKVCHGTNQAAAFATIYEQPFPLADYCGIGDLQNVASKAPTKSVGPEVPSEMTATILVVCIIAPSC